MAIYILASLAFVFLISWGLKKSVKSRTTSDKHVPYPPGPKPRFLIGNLFDLPTIDAAETYVEWGEKYNSDILHASVLGNHILVVNAREEAAEIFERRSTKYSDRPVVPTLQMIGWEWNVALIRYGEDWRMHRKICQQNFRQEAAPKYNQVQLKKMNSFLQGLIESPEKFEDHIKMFSVSIPLSMMYGYEVQSVDDPCVEAADESVNLTAQLLVPGGSFVNIFPFLRHVPQWFPGATSQKTAARVRMLTQHMMSIPLNRLKKRMVDGTAPQSLVSDFLERKATVGASEKEEFAINNVAWTVYGAASDTVISASGTFFYAMAIHPEVQKKAQEEIERVVGTMRLPNFGDRRSLPYIEAIYREVLRWKPPIPLGVPHSLTEDDYYKGYFIPKGTTVFGNIWAMTHSEDRYADPHSFKPGRFFDDDGKLNGDDHILAYGFGRRVCVGKHVASSTLWLLISSVLAAFNIRKAQDELGNEIEIKGDYGDYGLLNPITDSDSDDPDTFVMASKIVSAFTGPLTPTAIEAWLGQCEDGFAIYAATKADKSPNLDLQTKIRLAGSQLQEPSTAAWWSSGRAEFLKLATWDMFEKQLRSRFMPKGYKLIALRTFFRCAQGPLPFLDFATALAEARNAVGQTVITASIYKYQLLFHSHNMLLLRIMAIPDFDIDTINFDNLVALLSMQWDSLIAEGSARPGRSSLHVPSPQTSVASPSTFGPSTHHCTPLTDAEKERLTHAGGCWRCRKVPKDTSWIPHVGRTCPGDAAQGILPGRDYVPSDTTIKKEFVGMVLNTADLSGEDQPDTYGYYDDDSD
ncbi:cytochrome P450 [Flammula alnicola]|nr:cytochrome P450 [Flammula alnicola]